MVIIIIKNKNIFFDKTRPNGKSMSRVFIIIMSALSTLQLDALFGEGGEEGK